MPSAAVHHLQHFGQVLAVALEFQCCPRVAFRIEFQIRMLHEALQERRDFLRAEHLVGIARMHEATGHTREIALLGILRNAQAPRPL